MDDPGLGEVYKIYRPSVFRLWGLGLLAIGPLAIIGLVILISIGSADPLAEIWNMSACLAIVGLLLLVLAAVMVSELRRWKAARSIRLTLCTNGLIYEFAGNKTTCLWSEVQDVRYKQIRTTSKASPGANIRVIASIVRKDGTAFVLPDALSLPDITEAVARLRKPSL